MVLHPVTNGLGSSGGMRRRRPEDCGNQIALQVVTKVALVEASVVEAAAAAMVADRTATLAAVSVT